MATFDRYLLRIFLKVLLVCFVSITGLYIVIDAFNNLDEFLGYGRQEGSLVAVLTEYYSARIPWFFDRTGGLLALIAAMFAVTWLQRTHELTALQAAGIPKRRIIRTLIGGTVVVSALGVVNRELLIPALRDQLTRNAQDWRGENARRMEPARDNQNQVLIHGRATFAKDQRIEAPSFLFDQPLPEFGQRLMAERAYYRGPAQDRPGGYLLVDVHEPEDIQSIPSLRVGDRPVILTAQDTPWLQPNECFACSNLSFEQLAGGSNWRRLSSVPELIAGLRNPSLDFGLDAKVTIHSRLIQPALDLTLFFLGLPLVLVRENRNVFLAAGLCLLVVLLFMLVVTGCQMLGDRGYLLTPALAAWLPLFIFVPAATAAALPLYE
jgi:lipopolysaccharide export system permease protein